MKHGVKRTFSRLYGCLVPAGLDDENGTVSVEDLQRLPEVRVDDSAGHRTIAEAISTLGRGVLKDVPHVEVNRFMSLPRIVAECGFFAIVPVDAFSNLITGLEGTKLLELPFPSPRTGVHLISHRDAGVLSARARFLDSIRSALKSP